MLLLPTFHNNFECFKFIGTALLILFCVQFPSLAQDDTAFETFFPERRPFFAFTPNLSLQLYAQPFVSSGRYSGFKQVADPKGERYADRFTPLKTEIASVGYAADIDGDGTPEFIRNLDFNFKQFRSNVVLRWEYRLGSTLFVVWSQGHQHIDPVGQFNLGSDIGTLFDAPAENVFMIKLNYWLNPHELLRK